MGALQSVTDESRPRVDNGSTTAASMNGNAHVSEDTPLALRSSLRQQMHFTLAEPYSRKQNSSLR